MAKAAVHHGAEARELAWPGYESSPCATEYWVLGCGPSLLNLNIVFDAIVLATGISMYLYICIYINMSMYMMYYVCYTCTYSYLIQAAKLQSSPVLKHSCVPWTQSLWQVEVEFIATHDA